MSKNSSIWTNSVQHKHTVQNVSTVQLSKTFLFQDIQFSISMPLVLLNPPIGPYQVLPRRARVDLGAMAIKGYSTPYSPRPQHCWNLTIRLFSVISRTLVGRGVLPLCRGAVSVFYSPNRLGNWIVWIRTVWPNRLALNRNVLDN